MERGLAKIECHLALPVTQSCIEFRLTQHPFPGVDRLHRRLKRYQALWAVVLSASRSDAIELILALLITVAVQADEQNSKN